MFGVGLSMASWVGIVFWFRVKVARAMAIVLVPTAVVTTALLVHAAVSWDGILDPTLARAGKLDSG
jgi:hypothetical protein